MLSYLLGKLWEGPLSSDKNPFNYLLNIRVTLVFAFISVLLLLAMISLGFYSDKISDTNIQRSEFIKNGVIPVLMNSFFTICGLMFIIVLFSGTRRAQKDIEIFDIEHSEILKKVEEKRENEIFDNIKLNVNHLQKYYSSNLIQANITFICGIVIIILGVFPLIIFLWRMPFTSSLNLDFKILSGVIGLILEVLGGSLLFMWKRFMEQASVYFKQLIKDQNILLAINLAKTLDKEGEMEQKEKIIKSLLDRNLK